MGFPRHSPCLGYLSATLFILSIILQRVNSLHGVFKVQTKYVKSPFPTLRRPHGLRHHDRMLLDSSPVNFLVQGGNATIPLYIMTVGIGTPPQPHRLLVDTGSAEIWTNCAECENCLNDINGVHIPPFDPSLSSTAEIYRPPKYNCTHIIDGKCKFITGYASGGLMIGYKLRDKFLIENLVTGPDITPTLRFGCVTKHNYSEQDDGTDFFKWGIDGIIGFGDYGHSVVTQFNSTGIPSRELAHCLDNINGGGFFAIGHVMEPQVPMVDRFDANYDLVVSGLDFGGENVALNGSTLVIFDSGSDVFSTSDLIFQDINGKFEALLAQKNAIMKRRVNDSTCFQIPGRVLTREWLDHEFPNITIHFPGSMLFNVTPHNYIKQPEIGEDHGIEGFWCLYVGPFPQRWGEFDIMIIGSGFMSEKLMVFDNMNNKVGFVDHNCSVPIQVEGHGGKPVPLGL